jgi:hypothetical protein
MDRNTKIALGCGGVGCLGLIVVAIAGVLLYSFAGRSFTSNSNRRTFNFNLNSNSNSNADRSANQNSSDAESSDAGEDTTSSSSLSDDDKHKLFHAAGVTQDTTLIMRVLKNIGFMNESGTMTAAYEQFIKDHFAWSLRNTDFIKSVNTPAKARAYVEEHIND